MLLIPRPMSRAEAAICANFWNATISTSSRRSPLTTQVRERVEQYQGVPPFRETRAYVARIVHEYNIKKTAQAKETVLYSFAGAPSDGANPWVTPVFDKKGNLYGATVGGGAYNYGTLFELTPSHGKWTETILHSFDSNGSDGYTPYAGLVLDKQGNLYGTTQLGGAHGQGTVFEMMPTKNGWTQTILHSFDPNGTDGTEPFDSLVFDKEGNIYGTTYEGGNYNHGTVFELTPSGTETILHSFAFNWSDGYYPYAGLVLDEKGNLYGTTTYGGPYGEYGCGTIFELTPSGTETILHSFGASGDGSNPYGRLGTGEGKSLRHDHRGRRVRLRHGV